MEVWKRPSHVVSTLNHLMTSGTRDDLCDLVDVVTWQTSSQEIVVEFEMSNSSSDGEGVEKIGYKLFVSVLKGFDFRLEPPEEDILNFISDCRAKSSLSLFVFVEQIITKLNQMKQSAMDLIDSKTLHEEKNLSCPRTFDNL
eukprot:TRINITY_DN14273_c0_g1_i1.p1 TRINITY_DN14273_c0_g1~~TRINITY_DN14273_c0_g1_i1.p1  ORF type:complete len:142 (+),score=29.82 TRINITY_DN14273_c0_g1_i1:172-597(+)